MKMFADSLTVSSRSVGRVSCSPRVYASVRPFSHRAFSSNIGEDWVNGGGRFELTEILRGFANSLQKLSLHACWFWRRRRLVEAGARQKLCVFPRARPGKDALEWSDVQLATALTLTPSAVRWGKRRETDHWQCLHLLRYW